MFIALRRLRTKGTDLLHSPFGIQNIILTFFVVFLLSFRPPYFVQTSIPFGEEFLSDAASLPISESGFIQNTASVQTAQMEEVITVDEDGNTVVQMVPKRRERVTEYIVRSGDNISKLAHKFGLKVSTLLWANKLTSKETLDVGQKLRIPPTDGVFYTVQTSDTLSEIAKTHDIALSKIYAYNDLNAESVIGVGKEIFLPDANKLFIPTRTVVGTGSTASTTEQTAGETLQSIGIRFRRPTKGIITQGYHRSHYAIDIGNVMNTPIYAAAEGTVTTSRDGWNYGYGKYIIVDHGNGVETLYAHMNERKVSVGDEIKTGQLIGLMGNTGNVWGPTGIHLHFEVRIRGRKVNPNNYF